MKRDNKNYFGFLKTIDAFGSDVQLYFDGSSKYKTKTGGIITVTLIMILLLQLIPACISLIQRGNFTIQTHTKNLFIPPPINLTNQNFNFAFKLIDPSIQLNRYIVSYSAQIIVTTTTSNKLNVTSIDIPLRPCNISDFAGYEEQYIEYALDSAICPSINQFSLYGGPGNNLFQTLNLGVSACTNNSNNGIICAPQSEIDQYFINNQKVVVG